MNIKYNFLFLSLSAATFRLHRTTNETNKMWQKKRKEKKEKPTMITPVQFELCATCALQRQTSPKAKRRIHLQKKNKSLFMDINIAGFFLSFYQHLLLIFQPRI